MPLDEASRWEYLRAVEDPNVRHLIYDIDERLGDLEADQRLRQLAISVFLGAAPLVGIIVGMLSGVRISY